VDPEALLEEFHRRQAELYSGGSDEGVSEMLAEDVRWHVPGTSPIAGDHDGRDAVLAYMRKRREIAHGTMRMHPGTTLVDDDVVVQLVTGEATLNGRQVSWRTAGIYRFSENRVAEAWLIPFEPDLFDRIWSP
jgi:uncharacterized protein